MSSDGDGPIGSCAIRFVKTAAIAAVFLWGFALPEVSRAAVAASAECAAPMPLQSVGLAKVLDGDTITLVDGRRIRLIGVNTPERSHYGRREEAGAADATRFVERFLGREPLQIGIGQDPQDHYKRTLAHVFRRDGRSLEVALLEAGLAVQIVIPPNLSLVDCFHTAEERARLARRGLWREGPFPVARLQDGAEGFHLLEGRVSRVARTRSSWWIELDSRVSLRVDRSDWKRFSPGFPETLRGERVEARGWLVWRKAKGGAVNGHPPWSIRVRHPYAVSVLGA